MYFMWFPAMEEKVSLSHRIKDLIHVAEVYLHKARPQHSELYRYRQAIQDEKEGHECEYEWLQPEPKCQILSDIAAVRRKKLAEGWTTITKKTFATPVDTLMVSTSCFPVG